MEDQNSKKVKTKEALAYIRLEGEGLEEGIISAKTGANILLGIDRLVKRGVENRYPEFNDLDLEVPVLVKKGSWTAIIPVDLIGWLVTAFGLSAASYGITASKVLAKNDIGDKTLKEVVKKSFNSLQSTIKISKHLKGTRKKVIEGVRFEDNNQTFLIPNEDGKILKVKREEYEDYLNYPEGLLEGIATSPKNNQSLSIAVINGNKTSVESISSEETKYFQNETAIEGEENVLFPEMKHGDRVELVGLVTRANSQPNSMGFKYQDHIITCTPKQGKVEQFKPQLFKKCVLKGTVQRLIDSSFKDTYARPRLIIEELEIVELEEGKQTSLLR